MKNDKKIIKKKQSELVNFETKWYTILKNERKCRA